MTTRQLPRRRPDGRFAAAKHFVQFSHKCAFPVSLLFNTYRQYDVEAEVPEEFANLLGQWWKAMPDADGTVAGLVSDWLGDHADLLVPVGDRETLLAAVEAARVAFLAQYNDPRRREGEGR